MMHPSGGPNATLRAWSAASAVVGGSAVGCGRRAAASSSVPAAAAPPPPSPLPRCSFSSANSAEGGASATPAAAAVALAAGPPAALADSCIPSACWCAPATVAVAAAAGVELLRRRGALAATPVDGTQSARSAAGREKRRANETRRDGNQLRHWSCRAACGLSHRTKGTDSRGLHYAESGRKRRRASSRKEHNKLPSVLRTVAAVRGGDSTVSSVPQ